LCREVTTLGPLDARVLTSRENRYTGNVQILTRDILGLLLEKLPGDACCVLGITMKDLCPDPSSNFVFGQASLRDRVGVYSFARHDPAFYGRTEKRAVRGSFSSEVSRCSRMRPPTCSGCSNASSTDAS